MGFKGSWKRPAAITDAEVTAAWRAVFGVRERRTQCLVPPPGWWCSRGAGHEGPCAARPTNAERRIAPPAVTE